MVKITIPKLKLFTLNDCLHWTKKHARNKKTRVILKWYLKTIERPVLPVFVDMCRVAPREYDYVNLVGSMKGIQDIIADYLIPGLAPGRADGDKRITWGFSQRKGAPNEVALEITFSQEASGS